ncbi:transcriptional repressor [Puniceicoccaceae bacterium K14]|nr:transcriptional repressor [Puniceicoccaceae bacterium K14]
MASTDNKLENAISNLKKESLRITEPRKALLKLLIDTHKPLSAEELHEALGSEQYDLVTVYRNLETFEKAGIVSRIPTESGKGLYEMNDEQKHYHHIICRHCHKAEKLDECHIHELEEIATKLGFSNITHVLELYGVCQECR